MSSIKITHDIDDWMYDIEQINKERNLTRKEYCQYNILRKLRDKYYDIHKKQIDKLNNEAMSLCYKIAHVYSFKYCNKRLKDLNVI